MHRERVASGRLEPPGEQRASRRTAVESAPPLGLATEAFRSTAPCTWILAALVVLGFLLVGCGQDQEAHARAAAGSPKPVIAPDYVVSPRGGTPATGPGDRFNHCERIWCMPHGENFHIDHFLTNHLGWILHDDAAGDVFVPAGRVGGPRFPDARLTVLHLCGKHVHPHLLGRGGGPVRGGMYATSVGFNRSHWRAFGTQLDPCCTNGLGWDFVHSTGVGRFFRFHDLTDYRAHPERGWQKPFTGTPGTAPAPR